MDMSQEEPFYFAKKLLGKCCAPDGSRDRDPHFARACETHMDTSQGPSDASIYKKNAAPQMDPQTATHTLREPAQLKCTWTKTQEPFCARIYRKKAGSQIQHPDQAPAFTLT